MAPSESRSLSRLSRRKATPRRQPSDRALDYARAGLAGFTRSTAHKGTVGYQAANAVVYERRTAGRPEGINARTSAGHESTAAREATTMSTIVVGTGWAELDGLTRAERRRVARYNALASNLTTGDLSPRAFLAHVRAWRPIAGETFESDPDVVLAILTERREAGETTFIYRGRRR